MPVCGSFFAWILHQQYFLTVRVFMTCFENFLRNVIKKAVDLLSLLSWDATYRNADPILTPVSNDPIRGV